MKTNIFAAVLAGGSGTRMGGSLPKQFLEIGGCPILIRTLESFLQVESIETIFLVTPAEWTQLTDELVQAWYPEEKRVMILPGGADRSESLMQAIRRIQQEGNLMKDTLLITHDAVRPFVTPEIIEANIQRAQTDGTAMTVVPAVDTIIESLDGETIHKVPDRRTMYQMQTPQTFLVTYYLKAYEALSPEQRSRVTDASGVLMAAGIPVFMVPGRRENIKITWPEDLSYAEHLVSKGLI